MDREKDIFFRQCLLFITFRSEDNKLLRSNIDPMDQFTEACLLSFIEYGMIHQSLNIKKP